MRKSRTETPAAEALASPPVATVQLPLPLVDLLADTRTAFFGLCLDAGQQVLRAMMEQDRERLCGPKHVPNPDRRAYRACGPGVSTATSSTSRASPTPRAGIRSTRCCGRRWSPGRCSTRRRPTPRGGQPPRRHHSGDARSPRTLLDRTRPSTGTSRTWESSMPTSSPALRGSTAKSNGRTEPTRPSSISS